MLEQFYVQLEIETDKTVVLVEFIRDNEDVEFSRVESNLSKDEENEDGEAINGIDDNPPVADDTNDTHEDTTEEQVLPPNDPIPILTHKRKFGSLIDALDESKYVDLPPQKRNTYMQRRQ